MTTDSSSKQDLVKDGLLTSKQACEFLAISHSYLYQLMKEGKLVYVKIGKSRRIPKRALIELAEAHLVGGPDDRDG